MSLFISHSGEDSELARRIRDRLKRNGVSTYLALKNIEFVLDKALAMAIEKCDNMLCIVTPSFVASSWCDSELAYTIRMNKTVIPIRAQKDYEFRGLAGLHLSKLHIHDVCRPGSFKDEMDAICEKIKEDKTTNGAAAAVPSRKRDTASVSSSKTKGATGQSRKSSSDLGPVRPTTRASKRKMDDGDVKSREDEKKDKHRDAKRRRR